MVVKVEVGYDEGETDSLFTVVIYDYEWRTNFKQFKTKESALEYARIKMAEIVGSFDPSL